MKQDVEATYNADLWHLKLEDVARVERNWTPSLKEWRKVRRDDDTSRSRSGEYSERSTDSAEVDGEEDSIEEEGEMGGGDEEQSGEQRDEYLEYCDEASLDQPVEGDGDGDAPFVRHITDLVTHLEFPDRTDVYRRVVVGGKFSIIYNPFALW